MGERRRYRLFAVVSCMLMIFVALVGITIPNAVAGVEVTVTIAHAKQIDYVDNKPNLADFYFRVTLDGYTEISNVPWALNAGDIYPNWAAVFTVPSGVTYDLTIALYDWDGTTTGVPSSDDDLCDISKQSGTNAAALRYAVDSNSWTGDDSSSAALDSIPGYVAGTEDNENADWDCALWFTIVTNAPDSLGISTWEGYMPSAGPTTTYDQTVRVHASNDYAEVALAANMYSYTSAESLPKTADGKDQYKFTIQTVIEANSRKGMGYTPSTLQDSVEMWSGEPSTGDHVVTSMAEETGLWATVDRHSGGTTTPFFIYYYGVLYSRVWISENGFVCFESEDTGANPPTSVSTSAPNCFVAPLWRDLSMVSGVSKIIYGTTSGPTQLDTVKHDCFFVAWIDMKCDGGSPTPPDNYYVSFGVYFTEYDGVIFGHPHDGDIDLVYWDYYPLASTFIGCEDQLGKRGWQATPSTGSFYDYGGRMYILDPYTASWYGIDQVKFMVQKGSDYATTSIGIDGTGGGNPGGINVEGYQTTVPSSSFSSKGELVNAAKAGLDTLEYAEAVPKFIPFIGWVYSTIQGGMALMDSTLPVYKDNINLVADSLYNSQALAQAWNLAKDSQTGWGWANDVVVVVTVEFFTTDITIGHSLKMWTEVVLRDGTSSYELLLSNPVKTPVDGVQFIFNGKNAALTTAPSGQVSWAGRTVPDGHYVRSYPIKHATYGYGYHVDTIRGYADSGYKFMGWQLTNSATDYIVRPDGTIRVQGYFRQYDIDAQAVRNLYIYILNTPQSSTGYSGEFNTIIAQQGVLGPSEYDSWYYKDILVSVGSPWANKHVKVAIGREDSTYGNYNMLAEWAGIEVFDGSEYALKISAVGGGTTYYRYVNPSTGVVTEDRNINYPQTYSWKYSAPASTYVYAAASAGYVFNYWLFDGNKRTENPLLVEWTSTNKADHTLVANFRQPGFVLWSKFDESSGMTASDSSGNGLTGTLVPDGANSMGWGSANPVSGNYIWSSAYNSRVDYGNVASVTGDITIACYVRTDRSRDLMWVVTKAPDTGYGRTYDLHLALNSATGKYTVEFVRGNADATNYLLYVQYPDAFTVTDGTWHFIVARHSTVDGSYGISVDHGPWGGTLLAGTRVGTARSSTAPLLVGNLGSCDNGQRAWWGDIDDVRIWDRFVPGSELGISEGPSLWSKYDESSGSASDSSGHSLTGTLYGVSFSTDGASGNCIKSIGSQTDRVDYGNVLTITGDITISCWVKTTSTRPLMFLVTKAPNTGYDRAYDLDVGYDSATQKYSVSLSRGNSALTGWLLYVQYTSAFGYDGAWHLIQARHNTATGSYGIRVDGGAWGGTLLAGTGIGAAYGTPATLQVGNLGSGSSSATRSLEGYIDEVQIWNRCLADSELNKPPVASFTATASALKVNVDGSASSDSDGTISTYAWNWGDGTTTSPSAAKTASHTYAATGTYTIRLTVVDDDGAGRSTSRSVTLTGPSSYKLTISVAASPFSGGTTSPAPGTYSYTAGSSVQCTATKSGSNTFWYWVLDGVMNYANPITVPMASDHTLVAYFHFTSGCVAEGTMITMADGTQQAVEKLKVGDKVLGYDLASGTLVSEDILSLTSTKVSEVLSINDGALRVTLTDQPIFVRNETFTGWIHDPIRLQVGWQIFQPLSGEWVTISDLTLETAKVRVYDLSTTGPRDYIANSYLLFDKPQ